MQIITRLLAVVLTGLSLLVLAAPANALVVVKRNVVVKRTVVRHPAVVVVKRSAIRQPGVVVLR